DVRCERTDGRVMDSGRFLLAVLLMIALVVVTNIIFPPVPPAQPDAPGDTTGTTPARPPDTTPPAGPPDTTPPSAPAPDPTDRLDSIAGLPDVAATDVAADTIVAASRLFHYGVSTRGARIVRVQLDAHRSMREDGPVQLVPETAGSLVGYR